MLSEEANEELKRLAKSKKLREDFRMLRRFEEEAAKQPGYEGRRRKMINWFLGALGQPPLSEDTPLPLPWFPPAKTLRKSKRSR